MEKRIVNNYERGLTTDGQRHRAHREPVAHRHLGHQDLLPAGRQDRGGDRAGHRDLADRRAPDAARARRRPFIIRYSASNVPILQIALESDSLSEQQLFDYGTNFIRADIATIQGAQMPWPYGGKQRQIMIDIDPQRLFAWGLSPRDVNAALGLQNVIVPTGTAKIGVDEYPIVLNASPELLDADRVDIPIKVVRGTTVYMRDVANVRDGYAPQTNIVHVEGKKSVLMSILKLGSASTLDVVKRIRDTLPTTLARLPKELKVSLLFDQSIFVRAAVEGVVKEAGIAAGLTALMLLVFLGSWRSTLIVIVSIPLSILVSIIILAWLGETLNVMTLGGMALAVGILVDDATVEIENVHRNMAQNKPIVRAILDGASEIATPAFVSTLCICIVFVPVRLHHRRGEVALRAAGDGGRLRDAHLVLPLAHARADDDALPPERRRPSTTRSDHHEAPDVARPAALLRGVRARLRAAAHVLRRLAGAGRSSTARSSSAGSCVFVAGSLGALPARRARLLPHASTRASSSSTCAARPGTRIEETERKFAQIEDTIRTVIPPAQIETMLDNIGIPYSGLNLSLSEGALISSADGEIFIALKEGHAPDGRLRAQAARDARARPTPSRPSSSSRPDISTQVLNFGLAAPIDVQVVGAIGNEDATLRRRQADRRAREAIPGAADVHLAQVPKQPELRVDVNRTMAGQLGLTERDVASDLLVSLASSAIVAPTLLARQARRAVPRRGADAAARDRLDRRDERRRPSPRAATSAAAPLEHRLGLAHRRAR